MLLRYVTITSALLLPFSGCASNPVDRDASAEPTFLQKVAESTGPMRRSWNRVTKTKKPVAAPQWEWASGIPTGTTRSEIVSATLPADAVAHFVPGFRDDEVRLVSTEHAPLSVQIVNIGGLEVRNCADMHTAIERAMTTDETIQVDLAQATPTAAADVTAVEVAPRTLLALTQTVAREQPVMRIAEGGNQWLVIRDNGIRCKIMARVERSHGLLQVAMSLVNCWDAERVLPHEVRAYCNDQPLRCPTVSETLELLYGDPRENWPPPTENSYSFAAVSERDEYLLPTNYKRLQEETDEVFRKSASPPPLPAFANLPGQIYPGPAVLGDARALTGIVLQRQLFRPGDPEQTGWIVFAGESLKGSGAFAVDIDLDLGNGSQRFRFAVPAR